ncbi:MAG: hypothetical protein AMS27_06805 [Bacteroides sp. SM23_62_1]|nr:MAG: hypothetical protein AMS27_06805 [Bacteroides sp. SM23_62_1]
MSFSVKNIASVVVITSVLTLYLSENKNTSCNSAQLIPENFKIYNDPSQNDDRISDIRGSLVIQDSDEREFYSTGNILYHNHPISISDHKKSLLFFIDLPPPNVI